jgi:hypothetical protein
MDVVLKAWDTIVQATLRLLSKAPDDSRIMLAIVMKHENAVVDEIEIVSNVPQLTTIQALHMAFTAAQGRPGVEPDEEQLETLIVGGDLLTKLITPGVSP